MSRHGMEAAAAVINGLERAVEMPTQSVWKSLKPPS